MFFFFFRGGIDVLQGQNFNPMKRTPGLWVWKSSRSFLPFLAECTKTRLWFIIFLYVHPHLGKWSNLTIIFFKWLETTNSETSNSPKHWVKLFGFLSCKKIVKIKSLGIWSNQKWEMFLTVVDVSHKLLIGSIFQFFSDSQCPDAGWKDGNTVDTIPHCSEVLVA